MGFGGISPWSLLIILVIVLLLFGTKRLRNVGSDLGGAIKSFKRSMKDGSAEGEEKSKEVTQKIKDEVGKTIDAEVSNKKEEIKKSD